MPPKRVQNISNFAFDLVLIAGLFGSIVIYHDSLLNIWCVPIGLILVLHTLVLIFLFFRRRRQNPGFIGRIPAVRIGVLTGALIVSYAAFPRLSLAKEIVEYALNPNDFEQVIVTAGALCSQSNANYEIPVTADIGARHGWETARVFSDDEIGHLIILASRPDTEGDYLPVGGTAFVYAQQPQALGQRIDTPVGALYCHYDLGGGWLACVVDS